MMPLLDKVKSISRIENRTIRQKFFEEIITTYNLKKDFIIQSEVDKLIKDFNSVGINTTEKREDEIVISMTCTPSRFYMLKYALYSLMNQTKKPDKIILTLSTDEIPEKMIPDYISHFQNYGLEIKWIKENLKKDKKLFPLFETVDDNSFILFGDDDIYYNPNWLKTLYDAYIYYHVPCYYLFGRYEDLRTKKIMVLHPNCYEKTYNACNRSPVSVPLSGLGMILKLNQFDKRIRDTNMRYKLKCDNDDEVYLWTFGNLSHLRFRKIPYHNETKWNDIWHMFKVYERMNEEASYI